VRALSFSYLYHQQRYVYKVDGRDPLHHGNILYLEKKKKNRNTQPEKSSFEGEIFDCCCECVCVYIVVINEEGKEEETSGSQGLEAISTMKQQFL
jgi:hypothetical protein